MYAHERNLILMFLHIYRNRETVLINCLIVLINDPENVVGLFIGLKEYQHCVTKLCTRGSFWALINSLVSWWSLSDNEPSLSLLVSHSCLATFLPVFPSPLLFSVGRFNEAGLQWVNELCNLSRKKSREVAASLPGRFLSRRCFTLCITMDVDPELRSNTNATTVAVAKITGERWQRVEIKVYLRRFFRWPDVRDFVGKMFCGASYSTSDKLLLVDRHTLTTGLQKCL